MIAARSGIALAAAALLLAAAALPEAEIVVPVLDRPVEAGDMLALSDLVETPLAPGAARGALRLRDIAGMEAARRLPAGSIVRSSDVIRPQLVRRGEPVAITVRSGALVISTTGRALASGAAGAMVRVVTQSTSRTLEGQVEGPGAVRVMAN
jgi:flagella basal body P-ring formation protein FlgA